jgi:NADPH:quinone reductase-like Zn-dependent oxidoreductase
VRAARLHETGGTPRVDEIDDPRDGGGEVIEVSAAALNPVDIAIGNGRFYGGSPELPYVIGSEAIGRLPDGRRVWCNVRGAMAERIPRTDRVVEVPDGVDDAAALACGIAGLTGWLAVSWRAPVAPDDTVLVLGASGTLGGTAVQGAKLLGARRVVGAARHTDGIPAAADEVVAIDGSENYPEATLIVDGLWGEPLERALVAAAPGVRVVQLGQSAGPTATLQSGWVRGKVANILGHSLFSVGPDVLVAG